MWTEEIEEILRIISGGSIQQILVPSRLIRFFYSFKAFSHFFSPWGLNKSERIWCCDIKSNIQAKVFDHVQSNNKHE